MSLFPKICDFIVNGFQIIEKLCGFAQ